MAAIERCHEWMHRKREVLSLTGTTVAKRRLEVEFGIPNDLRPDGLDHSRAPVLLARVPKRRSGAINVTDGTGAQVATLTSEEAQQFAFDLLIFRAQKVVEQGAPSTSLASFAETPEAVARIRVEIERLGWPVFPDSTPPTQTDTPITGWWSLLANDELFRAMFAATSTHDAVVAEISTKATERRIVRIVYDAVLDQRIDVALPAERRWRASLRHLAQEGFTTLSESIGWKETQLLIETPGLEAPCPYEFDIEAPDGIDLTYVMLHERGGDSPDVAATPGERFGRVSHRAVHPAATLRLLLRIRPSRSYPAAVLFTAILAAGILTAGWSRLRDLAGAPDAASAVLLALPALFTAAVAQPGRASQAARLVLGARVVLFACGLLTYVAAVMLVLFPVDLSVKNSHTTAALRLFWVIDMGVCWLLVGVLLWPLVGPSIAARRREASTAQTDGG